MTRGEVCWCVLRASRCPRITALSVLSTPVPSTRFAGMKIFTASCSSCCESRQFAVLQPEDARGDVRRVHGLLAPSWHEDFCCFVVIADGTLIERTLNACSLTTTTGRQLPAPARPSFGAFAAEFLSAAAWRRSPMPRAHRPHMRLCPAELGGKCQEVREWSQRNPDRMGDLSEFELRSVTF